MKIRLLVDVPWVDARHGLVKGATFETLSRNEKTFDSRIHGSDVYLLWVMSLAGEPVKLGSHEYEVVDEQG